MADRAQPPDFAKRREVFAGELEEDMIEALEAFRDEWLPNVGPLDEWQKTLIRELIWPQA